MDTKFLLSASHPDDTENIRILSAYVSTEKGAFGGEVTLNRAATKEEHDDFIAILRGGEQKHSYRDLIVPVFLNAAIKRSIDTGEEVVLTSEEDF